MSKVLVLYYPSYGHIEAMAAAIAEGAREAGAQVDIKRVPSPDWEKPSMTAPNLRHSHVAVMQSGYASSFARRFSGI